MNQQCPICREMMDMDLRTPVQICVNQHICCRYCHRTIICYKKMGSCPFCRLQIQKRCGDTLYGQCQMSILQIEVQNQNKISKQKYNFSKTFIQPLSSPFGNNQSQYQVKDLCVKLMNLSYFDVAVPIFRRIIQTEWSFCERQTFLGLGSLENQYGLNENCRIEWYLNRYGRDISFFDLLALSQLFMHNISLAHQIHGQSWYKKLLIERPSCFQLWFGLAVEKHNLGFEREALELYFKVIEIQPTFAKSFEMIAFLYSKCQAHQQAEYYARKCLESEPINIFASYIICAASKKGYFDISQQVKGIMELQPGYIRPLFVLGTMEIKQRLFIRGKQILERCIVINPSFVNAIEEYAFHDPGKNGKDILYKHSAQFKRNDQQLSRYYWSLGCIQAANQKLDEAKYLFHLAIKTNPSHSESYEQLIELYWKQQSCEHLIQTWEKYWIYVQRQNLRMKHSIHIIMGIFSFIKTKHSVEKVECFIELWKKLNNPADFKKLFCKNKQYEQMWFYQEYLNAIESSLQYPAIAPVICLYIGIMINYQFSDRLPDIVMSRYILTQIKEDEKLIVITIMNNLKASLKNKEP